MILDQTPAPGIPIPNVESCTVPELLGLLAPKGAEMLVDGIRRRVFVPPLKEVKSQFGESDAKYLTHAAKITPEDRRIKWQEWTWTEIRRRQRVLGSLWNVTSPAFARNDEEKNDTTLQQPREKRVIFDEIEEVTMDSVPKSYRMRHLPGLPFTIGSAQRKAHDKTLYVYSKDKKLLRLRRLKFEGEKYNDALIAAQKARMFDLEHLHVGDFELSVFFRTLF